MISSVTNRNYKEAFKVIDYDIVKEYNHYFTINLVIAISAFIKVKHKTSHVKVFGHEDILYQQWDEMKLKLEIIFGIKKKKIYKLIN